MASSSPRSRWLYGVLASWFVACLNPLPDDFPSSKDGESGSDVLIDREATEPDSTPIPGGGTQAGSPGSAGQDGNEEPDAPRDQENPPVDAAADAGAPPDAGTGDDG